MPERSHLSIGEVLSLLREEFPDVTISKIRFLESQGLVDPERTPSGYRKFYEQDVDRLRWILRQQRENFLPLKVIRGRLSTHGEADETALEDFDEAGMATETGAPQGVERDGRQPTQPSLLGGDEPDDRAPLPEAAASEPVRRAGTGTGTGTGTGSATGSEGGHAGNGHDRAHPADTNPVTTPGESAPVAERPGAGSSSSRGTPGALRAPDDITASHPAAGSRRLAAESAAATAEVGAAPAPGSPGRGPGARTAPADARRAGGPVAATRDPAGETWPADEDQETFSVEELAAATGAPVALVRDLQQFGLISVHAVVAGTPYFDAGALAVVRAAAGFSRHGVEPRHLRAWRNSADREAGLYEQVIMPLLRQRNPEARRQAGATLAELAALGGDLRNALIDQACRGIR